MLRTTEVTAAKGPGPLSRAPGAATNSRPKALLTRASRLTAAQWIRLLRALLLLAEVDLRLRWGGYARLQAAQVSRRVPPARTSRETRLPEIQEMARVIGQAAALVPGARCLHRSLALLLWLRRRGAAADLRIGVRSTGEAIAGHAWIEWGGVPLNEDGSVGDLYPPLERCG